MGFVVSLQGFQPPARFDAHPWTFAQVLEAPAPSGPWAVIDALTISPVDPDPSTPAVRNFTTSQGTLVTGWYALVFVDALGGASQPSDPLRSSVAGEVVPPTPDQIRNESPLLRAKFPIPSSDPFAPSDLRNTVYQATALVQSLTWRLIDLTLGDLSPEGEVSEALPDGMIPIAIQAIARMAERIYVTTTPDFAEQLATGRRLRGFSAGPYSESYFAPGEFARRGASQGRPPVDQDDALDQALWALMTEDARDYFVWRSTGLAPPTGVATAFDYRRQSGGYAAGSLGGWPVGRGPDGY